MQSFVLPLTVASYIPNFCLVFSLVRNSAQQNLISQQSELWVPHPPNATGLKMQMQQESAQTAARCTGHLGPPCLCTRWMATAAPQLSLSQTCGLNRVELRPHLPLPLSRVSLRVRYHFGRCSAAVLGKCCSRLLGKPDLQRGLGFQPSGKAPQSCRPGQVLLCRNTADARLQSLKRAHYQRDAFNKTFNHLEQRCQT